MPPTKETATTAQSVDVAIVGAGSPGRALACWVLDDEARRLHDEYEGAVAGARST
jgi:hypothetical protein